MGGGQSPASRQLTNATTPARLVLYYTSLIVKPWPQNPKAQNQKAPNPKAQNPKGPGAATKILQSYESPGWACPKRLQVS